MGCCNKPMPHGIIPFFAGFTDYTPVIPKLYYDVDDYEQRNKAFCAQLHKLACYADKLNEHIELNADDIEHLETMLVQIDGIKDSVRELRRMIEELEDPDTDFVWDPRKGAFETSIEAMRDMLEFVTWQAYRCADIAGMGVTCAEIADCGLNVEGWAVCNALYFKGRVSDALPQYTEII